MSKMKKLPEIQLSDFYPFNLAAELGCDENMIYIAGMQTALDMLTERERKVVACRYQDRLTLEETGRLFNVNRERIRQIEAKALRKLRHPARVKMYVALPRSKLYELVDKYDKLARGYERLKEAYTIATNKDVNESEINSRISLNIKLEELDFSVRTYNCLRRAGKDTLWKICDLTADELIKIRNLGRKSAQAQEVVYKLAEYGLTLSGETTVDEAAGRTV